jgi:hypothetical protein
MRSIWNIISAAVVLTACLIQSGGCVAFAGQHSGSGDTEAFKKRPTQLNKSLKLTFDEQRQIAAVLQETEYLTEEIRQDQSLSPEERFVQNNNIIDRSNKRIETALNEKQKKTLLRLETKMRERLEDDREIPPDSPSPPPE